MNWKRHGAGNFTVMIHKNKLFFFAMNKKFTFVTGSGEWMDFCGKKIDVVASKRKFNYFCNLILIILTIKVRVYEMIVIF